MKMTRLGRAHFQTLRQELMPHGRHFFFDCIIENESGNHIEFAEIRCYGMPIIKVDGMYQVGLGPNEVIKILNATGWYKLKGDTM